MTDPNLDAQLKQFDAETSRKRQELVASAVKGLRDRLAEIDRQLSGLNKERAQNAAALDRLLGRKPAKKHTAAKQPKAPKAKSGHRRRRMTVEMKREVIGQILREEKVTTGFPLAAVVKRIMREAHLTAGDLSPKNIHQFMPAGYHVEGGGRKKFFSVA